MTKIEVVKKEIWVQVWQKSRLFRKKFEFRYDKKLKLLRKLKIGVTKIEVVKKKFEDSYDKNQGYLERNLSLGMTKN